MIKQGTLKSIKGIFKSEIIKQITSHRFFFFFFFFFFFIVCKITLLTLLTVRAKYITRQYSILPTIHAYWLLTLLNKTGLYLQFNTDSLKHNSN